MSDKQLTVYEFAQKVKAKYPEYNDIDDVELAKKIVAKYPEYENIVSFEEPKKKEESTPSVSSVGESVSPEETPEVKQHKKSFLDYLSETSPIGTGPLDLSESRVLRDQPTLMEVLKENPEYGNKMVNRSVAAAKTGILLAESDAGLRSVDFEEIADIQKVIQQNQPKEGDFFYNKNDGFVGFMYDLGRTLPESFISMGAAAETPLTAASVGTGAAAGTVVPGIGTAVGAAGGFAFATSAINEYGTTIMAMLDEEGIDITDAKELKQAFANEELIGKIKSKAAKRAGVIGLIDGISGGVAGKVSKKIVGEVGEEIIEQLAKGTAEEVIEQSSKAGRKILYKDVVETTVESLAGGTGEALGSLAAGQEISLRDVLLETLADPTSKIVSTGGSKAQSFMDGVSKNLEGSGNITEAQKSLLKLAKKDPKRFQDVVAASQYRNAGQIKQINAKIASLKESSEFGKDKSIDKLIGQLQRRKANLQMRTMSELRGADEAQLSQLSELGTEIEELNAKYSDGSLTGDAQQAVKEAINDKLEEFDAKYKEFGQDIEFSDRGDRAVELDEEVKETEEVKIDREIFSEEDKKAVSDLEEQLKTAVADKDTKKVQELTNSIIEIENKYRDAEPTEKTAEAPTEEAPAEEAPAEVDTAEEVVEKPVQEDKEAAAEETVVEQPKTPSIPLDAEIKPQDVVSQKDSEGNTRFFARYPLKDKNINSFFEVKQEEDGTITRVSDKSYGPAVKTLKKRLAKEEPTAKAEPVQEIDTETIGVEENTIEDAEFRIEDLNEEITIEKGNIKEAKDKAKEDIAAVRKSKLSKEQKAEKIEEIRAELQDNVDEINGNIGIYKEDINALKSDIRKSKKRIAKLSAPQPTAKKKPAPKKQAKQQIKTEEVEITLLEENGSVKPLTKSGPTTDPRNVQTGKMTIEYGDKGITFKTTEDTGRMKEQGGEIFVSNEQISKMPNIGKFEKNTKEYAQHVASMSGIADPKPEIDPIEGLMSRAIKVEDIGKEGTASAKRFTAKQGEQLTAMVNNFEKILKSSGARRVKVLFFNQSDSVAYRSYKTGKDSFASKGSYFDNTIVVNIDSADMSTLPHEMLHAYISSVRMDDKKIVQFTNAIENELNKGSNSERELAKELAAFRDRYIERKVYGEGKTKEDALIAEEFLAQYVGLLSTASEGMPKAKQLSFIDKIRAAVVKFLSKIGIVDKNLVDKIKTREDALNFINGFVDALQGRVDPTAKEKVLDQTQPLTDSPVEISSTDVKTSRQQIKTEGTYIKKSDLVDVKKLFSDFKKKNNREPNVWIWMSDQLKRGSYNNKKTGVTTNLEGGVGFAYDKDNKAKKIAWASGLSIKTLNERVAKADFIWFMAGSEKSSFNFSKGTTKTIIAEIEAGMSKLIGQTYNGVEIKEGSYEEFTKIALNILKDDKSKKWSAVKSALEKGVKVVDHPIRTKIASDLLNAGTTVKMNLDIHKFLHEDLGVPKLNEFHELIRDEFLKKNEYSNGDMSLIIKPEGVEAEANIHDTYPHAILGEVVGMPSKKNYVLDVVPEESKTVISKKTGLSIEKPGTPVMIKTAVGDVGAIYEGKDLSIAREQIDWQASLFGKGQVNPAIVNRATPVQSAALELLQGKITNAEYQETVRIAQPIEAITKFFLPASTKDMADALDSNKGKLLNVELEDGTIVGLRLDIPAYKNRNIWIVSVHDKGASGKSLTYGSVAWATNVQFGSNPKIAAFIAAGKNMDTLEKQNKSTIARMHGEWKNFEGKTKEEKDAAAVKKVEEIVAIENSYPGAARKGSPWRQIGMNPFRHSYFYDRRNGKPVVGASEVVQIGGLVYAKDVLYADRNDMAFEVSGYKDANGDPVRFQLELDDMDIQPSVYKKNIFQKIASQFVWTNIEKQARILFESKEGQVTLAVKEGREISKNLRRLAKDKETLDMMSDYMEGIDRTAISKKLSKTSKGVRILDLLRDADAMVESFGNQIVDDPAFETLATELKFAITNNAGTYLKTRYRFFTDKKYKIKDKARKKAIQAERDMIVARQLAVLKKAGLSEEEIDQTIQDSISDINKQAHESIDLYINKLENIKKAPSVTGADIRIPSSSFQMKKDIAYHIQELLGVEKDPVTRFSATVQAQANILYKGRMVQGLLDMSQGVWDEYILDSEPDPAKAPLYKFVKDPYSPLNGKYVHEEIMNIFDRKPLYESDKAWLQAYFSLLKIGRKSKVIWNIPTWRKNLTGGWYFMLVNGVLANPRMYKDLKDRLTLTVNSDKIMTDPQTKAWLKVMGKKGLLGANVDAQLIGINDAAYQYMYDGDEKAYKRAFKKVYSSLSNFDKFLQEKYSAVDDYTKLVIFRMEVESFAMKIYGKEYESLTEAQKDRVHDDAAEFVKQNTPTFSRLPKFYDKLAVIPIVGDFVSFQFESIRSMSSNILNGVEDMKIAINGVDKNGNKLNEEQTKAYKASAGKRLVGTLSALALKYAMVEGFQELFLDDEDEELAEDAKRVSPEWMKGQSLIVKSIKKNGDVRVYNYSSEDPYGTVGDLTSPAGWGSLLNTFIRPNIAADYIFRAVKGEDIYGRKLFDKSDTAVENALAFLGYTAKTFIVPPFISSSYRDVVSKNEKNAIDLFTEGETAKDLSLTIGERSFMRDYQYNILDQFRYSVKDIASNKPLKDAGNIDKRYRHLDSVREDYYAIKRIAISKGNPELSKKAKDIIKRNFDQEEERFIFNNLRRR